ncbi:MAG: glutamate racemase [Bacteroidales bacterium]|jgi:glutamate racemase|nr:glutamate racemase [Bacteroidales bacterium]OQC03730.1 MAG: Glutamate racemase [Bacteroidetes bacterium ADurb.Bin090]MBP8981914.1 glutamate racemase [Bacteroidales bacterium]HNZ80429.1 glutamate racemase [Bacteroidales bacterium]HOD26763.1 glutamate racemase [Bacteroidales bacterium]
MNAKPIGVFDSGYGGLTILEEFRRKLPQYDYLYLGDNARTPYGSRSFELVNQFTLEAVRYLFGQGCRLIILACNTASAKALRNIQQQYLPSLEYNCRVLGVLRPTVEALGSLTKSGHVGLVGTQGTVQSGSYPIEIQKLFPDIHLESEACPMWVPLVENGEHESPGASYFVKQHLDRLFQRDPLIDTLILGCTHYPLLINQIRKHSPLGLQIVVQGKLVAESLSDYLQRHPEIEELCSKGGSCRYLTTEAEEKFEEMASVFSHTSIRVEQVHLNPL